MATIPLRDYCREIENMIDKGHTDEAIGHCRHILKYFPKHIETYRLLGKAYLESKQLGNAADIFQRVLSSIPDDFVSHIGMSIIREDEGNIDAALWHMERAYENQPANIAIQDELKRLHAAREGQEPVKIRLTRGALAHMYANGHLYAQAIAELRAALATDPKRLDLQTLLAHMYHADRQSANAAKIASQLLNKLPYCLIANRVLGEILTANQRPSEATPHLTRLHELDPYYKHLTPPQTQVAQVPSGMVVIEVLDWEATKGGLISQPAWATSIGVDIRNAPAHEELPEWFSPDKTGEDQAPSNAFGDLSFDEQVAAFSSPALPSDASQDAPAEPRPVHFEKVSPSLKNNLNEVNNMREEDDNLPDWMKSAGWSPRDPNAPEDPPLPLFDDEEEEPAAQGDIAKADIPDWLKAMAPNELTEGEETSAPASSDDLPDWLQGFNTAETVPTRVPSPRTSAPPPAWMSTHEEPTSEAEPELPDWLKDDDATAAPSQPGSLEKADVPDWLKGLGPADAGQEETSEMPDWLGELSPAEAKGFDLNDMEESTAPEWLQDFGEEIASSTLPSGKTEAPLPDWLSEEETQPETEEPEQDDLFAKAETAAPASLSWLDDLAEEEADDPSLHSGITDWLTEIGQPTAEELPEAEPATDIPAWLQDLGQDLPMSNDLFAEESTFETEEEKSPSFEIGDLGKDAGPGLAEEDFGLEDDVMAWLEALAAKQGAKEEELLTNRASREDTHLPSWLEELTDETAPAERADFSEEEEMLPEWLKGLDQDTLEPATNIFEEEEPGAPVAADFPLPTEEEPAEEIPAQAEEVPSSADMEMPDMDDADAAMAWLEALAAKQGAKEEELLTAPEDRRDDIPDWLKGILDEEALEEPASPIEKTAISTRTAELVEFESAAPSEPEFLEEEEPAFPEPESEPAPALPAADTLDEDAALAWLESLAMKHGVNEAELLTEVEKRPEGTPDWVNAVADKARAEEQAQVEAEELALQEIPDEIFTDEGEPLSEPPLAEIEPSETPDWLAELSEAETEAPPAEEEALPEWLTDSAANWIATLSEETPAETPEAPVQAEEEEMPVEEPVTDEPAAIETVEFPAWLMEEESAAESPDWVLEEPSEAPAATESIEVPSWILRKAPEESLAADLEIPAWLMEEAPEEALADDLEIPAWLMEEAPEEALADDLEIPAWLAEENLPAEEEPEDLTPAQEPEPAFEAEPEIESEPASEAPLLVAAGEALTQARTTLARGEVAAANAHYARLIKTNQNIDEAITDITEALNTRYPVDIDLWLSLGDAYVKKSKLQDALDAYTKAEELLR